MRFRQLDSIVEIQPGVEIVAERTISDRDRYFMDHCPDFYFVPGVLTLEAMSHRDNASERSIVFVET